MAVALLPVLFFLSGASALLFEMLWFRQAGLAFGNSIWASSLVLSGFMGGLALGNALAARFGDRVPRPLLAYGVAEATISAAGVGLVVLLPALGGTLGSALRPLLDQPWILNPLRLFIAFLLLLVPATAMGVTLPLMTRALAAGGGGFGSVLGRLYGWNTLGAVVGVVSGEAYLIGVFGVRGTALVAGALGGGVAIVAIVLSRGMSDLPVDASRRAGTRGARPIGGWLAAAFLAGFSLLALEVVWFRFLLLFVKGDSLALALMLAAVLAGIALGGLAASVWLRLVPAGHRAVAPLAFLTGASCVVSYAAFPEFVRPVGTGVIVDPEAILRVAVPLTVPVSFLSGALFTLIGAALRRDVTSDAAAAGLLTLANTTGAALGAFAAGFLLLPMAGMERALLLSAIVYGAIGVLLLAMTPAPRRIGYAAAAVLLLAVAGFPFGLIERGLLQTSVQRWLDTDARVLAIREGLTETIVYFERVMFGRPLSRVMLTNSYSMSADGYGVRRYQKLYVYWPLAVHPDVRSALLIGYGVGNTAQALTDSDSLATIDVVDLSRDILAMNRMVRQGERLPLDDPRVRVHIEDGRYFLQATDRRFDLITGEPPPPGIAGVETLYTREYFQLLHDRLADGGIVTYWLPLSDLTDVSGKAILAAFCDAFTDCSLWNGSGTHLMMAGTRNARGPVSAEQFTRQWTIPSVAAEMRVLGLEEPGQLGALFIGDAAYLRAIVGDVPPLVDDRPKRIEAPFSSPSAASELYEGLADVAAARLRFEESPLVGRLWPSGMRAASLPYFEVQDAINAHMYGALIQRPQAIEDAYRILTQSSLRTPVLWRLGSNGDIQRLVEAVFPGESDDAPLLHFHRGIRLLSERSYLQAAEAFDEAQFAAQAAGGGDASVGENAFALEIFALCMAGRVAEAEDITKAPFAEFLRAEGLSAASVTDDRLPPFWLFMKRTFGLDPARP